MNFNNLKNKFLNNFEKNKSVFILFFIVVVLIVLSIFLFFGISNKENKDFSKGYEKVETEIKKENNILEQNNTSFIPPKMENPFIATKEEINATKNNNEPKIADISSNSLEQEEQKEIIKKIKKTQKPKDMIEFLKEIQKDITLLSSIEKFEYELKQYSVGDKFLNWYEIEEINNNYIRFNTNDYSYNLRFLKEEK